MRLRLDRVSAHLRPNAEGLLNERPETSCDVAAVPGRDDSEAKTLGESAVSWVYKRPNSLIRYAGTTLQVFGLVLVAHGLDRTMAALGKPTMNERVRRWLQQLVGAFRRPQNIALEARFGSGVSLAGGATAVGHGSVAKASIEQRLER